MSSYFTILSFARAKQNKEKLEQSNPQNPVLRDEDQKFLEQQIEAEDAPPNTKDEISTIKSDGGGKRGDPQEDTKQTAGSDAQVGNPEMRSDDDVQLQYLKGGERGEDSAEEAIDIHGNAGALRESKKQESPDVNVGKSAEHPTELGQEAQLQPPEQKKAKKRKSFDLPSQEEAEAATRNFNFGAEHDNRGEGQKTERRTWASYLPSLGGSTKNASEIGSTEDNKDGESRQRTWAEYASSAYSSIPTMQSLASSLKLSKDKDSKPEPVYNEDGSINQEKTREKEEREVSVLLDNLNMSSINNRVFAFSADTQKIYMRFSQVLKDTMEGAPTAYEDMEKLMREAGPQLEKQFNSMPPFVQTLVKSLPAKLGTTLGPELMAAASEKPGADMKTRMAAASKPGGDTSLGAGTTAETGAQEKQKKRRRVPGLKGLVSEQGAVASILRNVVNFLRVRFPFLASTTNVVMSLAVFILMFVFWYCHKRGKETRLAREEAASANAEAEYDDDMESDVTDEDMPEDEEKTEEADESSTRAKDIETLNNDAQHESQESPGVETGGRK